MTQILTAAGNKPECIPVFTWDEPEDCTSPRGWVYLANHPDEAERGEPLPSCGNYLEYTVSRGPDGETIHAVAYLYRCRPPCFRDERIGLGWSWFHTIEEAKAFIMGNVLAYFGLPRE